MRTTLLGILMSMVLLVNGQEQELKLWYDAPAERWEETLPLGNGLIGMMPSGKVEEESVVLNEISMWSGSPQNANNSEAHQHLDSIQQFLFQGRNDEAEELVNQYFVCAGEGSGYGNGAEVPYGAFQNFGFLNFIRSEEHTSELQSRENL